MITRLNQSIFVALLLLNGLPPLGASEPDQGNPSPMTITTPTNAEDQFLLGRAYARGEGVGQSYETAGIWYRKSAEQGNLKAMHNLGILFLEGQGTAKNEAEGYRWIRLAAEKGNPRSAYLTGLLLTKGRGVALNTKEGVAWFKKAADAGNADALARLGQDTYFGDDGITKDLKAAIPLIQAAAEKGNPWACDTLGLLYMKGEGVPKDDKKSFEWLAKGTHATPWIH